VDNRAAGDGPDDATGRDLNATCSSIRRERMSEDKAQIAEKLARVYYRQG
jgi:hypothetical protein